MRLLRAEDRPELERFLQTRPDSSLIMLSNLRAAGLTEGCARYHGTYAAAFSDGAVAAAAAHYWNGMLVLQAPDHAGHLAALAISASKRPLTGLLGPARQVADLRRDLNLSQRMDGFQSDEALLAVELKALRLPVALSDWRFRVRPARSSELDILANWRTAFLVEAFAAQEDVGLRAQARAEVEAWQQDRANLVLTREGQLVAACAVIARYDDALQLGAVWTPKALRGRGYARCLVAGSLARLGEQGARRAVLFTSNPAAMRVYEAVGFQSLGAAYSLVRFAAPLQFNLARSIPSLHRMPARQVPLANSRGAA